MAVKLSKNSTINILDTIKNPNTGVQSRILIFLILLLVSESLYILLKKNKISKFIILIIATTIIIPIGVSALCKYEIELKSSVTIKKEYKVAYLESYSCPDNTIISNHTSYTYSYGNLYNNYGYTYNINDKAIMNFSNINHDYWDNYNVLNIGVQAFTMPAHDVLFDAYWD